MGKVVFFVPLVHEAAAWREGHLLQLENQGVTKHLSFCISNILTAYPWMNSVSLKNRDRQIDMCRRKRTLQLERCGAAPKNSPNASTVPRICGYKGQVHTRMCSP
ncbi:hypothetical protein V8C42DRAFT_282727 [Trichoderma barbatum]